MNKRVVGITSFSKTSVHAKYLNYFHINLCVCVFLLYVSKEEGVINPIYNSSSGGRGAEPHVQCVLSGPSEYYYFIQTN